MKFIRIIMYTSSTSVYININYDTDQNLLEYESKTISITQVIK